VIVHTQHSSKGLFESHPGILWVEALRRRQMRLSMRVREKGDQRVARLLVM